MLAFQGHPTRLRFLELCFSNFITKILRLLFKKIFCNFPYKDKTSLESSNEIVQQLHVLEHSTAPIRVTDSFGCGENFRINQSWNRMPSKIDIKCLITCTPQFLMSRLMDRKAYYSNSSEKGRQYIRRVWDKSMLLNTATMHVLYHRN